ncbi:MAG: hypothetical protein J5631_11415 [Spirochaetaceae bacterium]|nr:hypothetical protein [Spirochaetaceae bacterium]
MHIVLMSVTLKKKPLTIYFQELEYLLFQKMAKEQNRKITELVYNAIDEYIKNHTMQKSSFGSWKPVSLGGLKQEDSDWISKDYQDEI